MVTERAKKILADLEAEPTKQIKHMDTKVVKEKAISANEGMSSLFANPLNEQILALDVMSMTPLEAINKLYQLQQEAKKEAGKI